MKFYVLGFAFNADRDHVVLIQKNKPDWQKGSLNGVGGKIEGLESPRSAMAREFQEETTVTTEPDEWEIVGKMYGEDWECHVFTMADDKLMSAITATDEEVSVYTVEEIVKGDYQMITNIPFLLELCRDERRPKYSTIEY